MSALDRLPRVWIRGPALGCVDDANPRRHSPVSRIATAGLILVAISVVHIVGGCNQAPPTPSRPSASGSSIASATSDASIQPTASSSSADASSASLPVAQTDTDWGRIWDNLPTAFPIYPGAAPADEAQSGPVSATFAVEGQEARAIVAWMRTELERAAYRIESLNGPLEDGGFVLESAGAGDCRIEVVVAPLGSLTTVTVRYGAACPSP